MGWLPYQNKEKKMDFTILYDDKPPEFVSGNTIQDIYLNLEQTGTDYIEVIPGRRNITPEAIKRFKNDPTAALLTQIKDETVKIPSKIAPEVPKIPETVINQDSTDIRRIVINQPTLPQFFEDDGNEYKLENNILYKKVWVDCDSARILQSKTGKPYTGNAYKVQTQEWKKVSSN
jgi:hypothetical protein